MDWVDNVVRLAPAVVPLLAAVGAFAQGPGQLRRQIAHDAEVASKLPDSPARDHLLEYIDSRIQAMASEELRRNLPALVLGAVLAAGSWSAAAWLVRVGGWWQWGLAVALGVLGLIGLYGMFESARLIPRDDKGMAKPTGAAPGEATSPDASTTAEDSIDEAEVATEPEAERPASSRRAARPARAHKKAVTTTTRDSADASG